MRSGIRFLILSTVLAGLLTACAPPTQVFIVITSTPEPAPATMPLATNTPRPTLVSPATESSRDATETPPATSALPTATLIPGAIGPVFPSDVNPLTGVQVENPAVLDRRPIVTKISNAPPLVRPQAGIGMADLVYEHYAEGGLTRFSAVFYSQLPERAGSVRSSRIIDYELVPMYQALLIYSGASNGVNALIAGSEFADRAFMGIQYGNPYYWRDEEIEVPHNLFANPAAISALAGERGINQRPTLEGMVFHPDTPLGEVSAANAIDIRYRATRVRWTWDGENGVFRRFSDGQPHYDALTEAQVTADNVVIIFADHQYSDIVESEWQGNVTYGWSIKLWFEGDAMLFRDGKRYDVRWWRPTREGMIRLVSKTGEPVYMKPGNTWFQVMRLPEQLDPEEEGVTVE